MAELLRVDIESVNSSEPRSKFSETDLEFIANRILESGGVLKPLVLKKTGFEKYEVVDGHFEYYAAVRAGEKNPHVTEVNALIIAPESEEAALKQTEALKSLQLSGARKTELSSSKDSEFLRKTQVQIDNLANEIQNLRTELVQRLENSQRTVDSKKSEPLEVFNNLNVVELNFRLRSAGFTDKNAAKIADSIEKERKKEPFTSLSDIVARVKVESGKKQVKGISSDKMIAIIDSWSRISFN